MPTVSIGMDSCLLSPTAADLILVVEYFRVASASFRCPPSNCRIPELDPTIEYINSSSGQLLANPKTLLCKIISEMESQKHFYHCWLATVS